MNEVQALVKRLGDDRDFVLNAHGRLTPGDAARVAAAIEGSHPLWFDEPCSVSNLEAVRKISGGDGGAAGIRARDRRPRRFSGAAARRTGRRGAAGHSAHGISGARRIAALAETYYVAVAPHHDGGPVATAAALHLAASVPNFFIQHVPYPEAAADREMRAAIVSAGLETPRDGFLELPRGPGLGIEVNEAALEKYHAA